MSEQRRDAEARPPAANSSATSSPAPNSPAPSVWGFLKWSAISLFVIVALGLLMARLLHALGIE